MPKPANCARAALLSLCLCGVIGPAAASDDGSVVRALIPAVAYGATFQAHDRDGRKQFYRSFAASFAATHGLKSLISKTRPDGSDDKSFPSGHTSMAFQGAAFIHARYGLKYAAAAYLGASYVGWRRVATDRHFAVDVVAGAAIGVASSMLFTRRQEGVSVAPLIDGGFYGITVSRAWF